MDSISHEHFKSVVKIFAVKCQPNYSNPWQMQHQQHSTSSGFIIEGKRIMCNAHGISYCKTLRVRKHSDPTAKKYRAKVLFVAHECDLALITCDDPKFWENTVPLQFGDVPELQSTVVAIGYPTGGDNICITRGVTSRIGFHTYSHSLRSLLTIQIDAAINSGSSGGPAMQGDKVVGVNFQSLTAKQNIGYCIPTPVIHHFLTDIANHNKFTGFPYFGIGWSKLENPSHKLLLGLGEDETGIFIKHSVPLTDAGDRIQRNDVILAIDDTIVASDGTIPYRDKGERLSHRYLITQKFTGDKTKASILRDGKKMDIDVVVDNIEPLVPYHHYESKLPPDYFIFGGLCFLPLSRPWLSAYYGREWSRKSRVEMTQKAVGDYKENADEQVLVLSHILSDDINFGYEGYAPRILTDVNEKPVTNMVELTAMVDNCDEKYIKFGLFKDLVLVLDVKEARDSLTEILDTHSIPRDRSLSLLPNLTTDVAITSVENVTGAAVTVTEAEEKESPVIDDDQDITMTSAEQDTTTTETAPEKSAETQQKQSSTSPKGAPDSDAKDNIK